MNNEFIKNCIKSIVTSESLTDDVKVERLYAFIKGLVKGAKQCQQ